MRIAILGAGPAGLYLGYLIKRRRPDADVTVIEQNPADATFGFGVVFSDRALEFLREDDAETFAAIAPQMESWNDITLVHRNERIVIDGIGFAAIGRLKLLQLLQARVRSVGIEPQFGRAVTSLDEFDDADLVVGADGVNSLVRRTFAEQFGASVTYLANRFAWFGTSQGLRHPDADLPPHADRRFQRASLPLRAGAQHLHRRGGRGDLRPRRLSRRMEDAESRAFARKFLPTRSTATR